MVGLGNPGTRYAPTRHNVGFTVLDRLAQELAVAKRHRRYGALIAKATLPAVGEVALLWPQQFMNESGKAVSPAVGELHLPLERMVVVHDELDLPFGLVRLKQGGGHGGHNGLRSLIEELGSPHFWRIRVGIGRPATTDPEVVSRYVLSPFEEGVAEVEAAVLRAVSLTRALLEGKA